MATNAGRIAVVTAADNDIAQKLLASLAAEWRRAGLKVAGLTTEAHGLADRSCSAGILCDIATGVRFRIHLDEPPAGTSCHLDGSGVSSACAAIIDRIADSDVVVLSKFGKLEAQQKCLYPAFEAALMMGKPILTTVARKHRDTFTAYAPQATSLEPDAAAITAWCGLGGVFAPGAAGSRR